MCLTSILSYIWHLTNLTCLDLRGCVNLPMLPYSLGSIVGLRCLLLLGGMESLLVIPDTICNLTNLVLLDLSCLCADRLPAKIGNLAQLTSLDLSGNVNLKCIPFSASQCTRMHELNLSDCEEIKLLPEFIQSYAQLSSLCLNGLNLTELPEWLDHLVLLTRLDLHWIDILYQLPPSLRSLGGLTHLDLGFCIHLRELSPILAELTQLATLYLGGCTYLHKIDQCLTALTSLTDLNANWCTVLPITDLEWWVPSLVNLRSLSLDGLRTTELFLAVSRQRGLSGLTSLSLEENNFFELPPYVAKLLGLCTLNLGSCKALLVLQTSLLAL